MHSVFMKIAGLKSSSYQQESDSFPLTHPAQLPLQPGAGGQGWGIACKDRVILSPCPQIRGVSAACQHNKGTNCDVDICKLDRLHRTISLAAKPPLANDFLLLLSRAGFESFRSCSQSPTLPSDLLRGLFVPSPYRVWKPSILNVVMKGELIVMCFRAVVQELYF